MNKKSLILAVLLLFVVIVSSSTVFAQDTDGNAQLMESDDEAIISQSNDNVISSQHTISAGSDSAAIQEKINSMSDGDTLNFEAGEYKNICIYINKNITVNGNGATLIGYDNPSKNSTPEIIYKSTEENGYAIGNLATLYIVKTTGVTISGLNIIGGANSSATYSNALVYAMNSNNMTFKNNTLDGSSWGLYLQFCNDDIISENTIKNQKVTGILNFGSARTAIEKNTVINAQNHGIDVRHGTGPNVQVTNNTVIGSKEGIYLMHSKGHTAADNTLINCSISSITCYGSSNIELKGNKMQKSRIGVLLGGGYSDITVGENTFALDNLPYPPTFVYYVAEAKADFQSAADIMGTHSDSSTNSPNYVAFTGIDAPKDISIDYDKILAKTGTEYTVPEGTSGSDIQKMIDGMKDGDSLSFAKNAVYENISIYTDKNIKIFGNNATLVGYDNINMSNVPDKVKKSTEEGGYAVAYRAVLYVLNTTNAVVSDLNIKAQFPGYDTTKVTAMTDEYKTAGIYADSNTKLTVTGCDVTGSSWGIFQQYSKNSTISKNSVHDVYTTGIMNFGSPNAVITENTITDATNHGIDVRHGTGPNVTIFKNTVTGAKEGIYLMHSKGHTVYENTIADSKISGITAYGSGNENIFNNTITGSRIGILLGGGYYNVTIGQNDYTLDFLPFPPTFVTYLAKAESKYQSADDVMRTYSDKDAANLTYSGASSAYVQTMAKGITYQITLKDAEGKALASRDIIVNFNDKNSTVTTDENGTASIKLAAKSTGSKVVTISFAGDNLYSEIIVNNTIKISKEASKLTAKKKTFKAKTKTKKYTITLKSKSGKAIKKAKVTIKVKGKTYKAKTNSKGKATFKITKLTKKGKYTAKVKFAGNSYYSGKTVKVKITVKK